MLQTVRDDVTCVGVICKCILKIYIRKDKKSLVDLRMAGLNASHGKLFAKQLSHNTGKKGLENSSCLEMITRPGSAYVAVLKHPNLN